MKSNKMNEQVIEMLLKTFLSDTKNGTFQKDKDQMYAEIKKIYEEEPNEELLKQKLKNYLDAEKRITGSTKEIDLSNEEHKKKTTFKYISYGYAIITFCIVVFYILNRDLLQITFPFLLLWLFLGLTLPKLSKGLITYGIYKNQGSAFIGLLVLSLGSLVISGFANSLNYPFLLWLVCGILSAILVYFIIQSKEFESREISIESLKKYRLIPAYFALFYIFLFNIILIINTIYDNSEPKKHNTKIIDKKHDYDRKKHEYFHFEIEKWHDNFEDNYIVVGEEKYNSLNKGDSIVFLVKEGLFGISWYSLETEKEEKEF